MHMVSPSFDAVLHNFEARRFLPLDAVIERAEGPWLYDADGRRYLDCLTVSTGAVQGHCHPRVMRAMAERAARMTLTDREAENDALPPLLARIREATGHEVVVLCHATADALTIALDAARQAGGQRKGIRPGDAAVIACSGNDLGLGREPSGARPAHAGCSRPGFPSTHCVLVPFGDIDALASAITRRTVAVVVAPVHTSRGLELPPDGYLSQVAAACVRHDVLLIVDETQTGFGRLGHLFAHQAEDVVPDMLLLGTAMSSGCFPASAVTARGHVAGLLRTFAHDATFKGNPVWCAAASAAVDVVVDEHLVDRSRDLGRELLSRLRGIESPYIRDIRGRGLWVAIDLTCRAHPFNEALMDDGVAVNDAGDATIRLSPALTVSRSQLAWLADRVGRVLDDRAARRSAAHSALSQAD